MTFSAKTGVIQKQYSQTLSIFAVAVLIIGGLAGCTESSTPENASTEPPSTETPAQPEPTPAETASPEPEKESRVEAAKPTLSPSNPVAPEVENAAVKLADKKPPAPAAKASPPRIEFPEMKMSDKAIKVRDLFIEANNQFKEKRFVGAIQTIRKLDAMELSEKEEMAVDLFLKRIEKALKAESGTTTEATTKE